VSAYSVGPDVKFICAPLSIRKGADERVTWAVYELKGGLTLLSWIQKGVDCVTDMIPLPQKEPQIQSLLSPDEIGEWVLVNYGNTRLECHNRSKENVQWTWDIPQQASSLRIFKASECPPTRTIDGHVLLAISTKAEFYPISPENPPSDPAVSLALEEVISFV